MTAKHSSRPCPPTALGRRFRITLSALALSAVIGLGTASQSLAAPGSVYFDGLANAAAGETFSSTGPSPASATPGLGPTSVMP